MRGKRVSVELLSCCHATTIDRASQMVLRSAFVDSAAYGDNYVSQIIVGFCFIIRVSSH